MSSLGIFTFLKQIADAERIQKLHLLVLGEIDYLERCMQRVRYLQAEDGLKAAADLCTLHTATHLTRVQKRGDKWDTLGQMGDLAGDDGAGTSIAEYCMADWPTFVTVEGIDMKKKKHRQ